MSCSLDVCVTKPIEINKTYICAIIIALCIKLKKMTIIHDAAIMSNLCD